MCFSTKETIHDLVSEHNTLWVCDTLYSSPSDYLTVSETAKQPPQDESGINSPQSLAVEATYINQNFSQQMLMVS